MQEECEDYYESCNYCGGCCLKCYDSHKGCLCYDCKCKECYWYSALEDGSGECEKKYELIKKNKIKFLKNIALEDKKKNKLYFYKELYNKNKEELLKQKGIILNYYSCQKCGFEFVEENELIIVKGKIPLCDVCKNKIVLTEREINLFKEEIDKEFEKKEFEDDY